MAAHIRSEVKRKLGRWAGSAEKKEKSKAAATTNA